MDKDGDREELEAKLERSRRLAADHILLFVITFIGNGEVDSSILSGSTT